MLINTLKTLCALPGASGMEDDVREFIIREARPHADEIVTDSIGNVMVFKKGRKTPQKRLMLASHMDEVGVIVMGITEDGYLKFDFVGGVDRRVVIGQRVWFGNVMGVIGLRAVHLANKENKEDENVPKTEDLYIDIGAPDKKSAEKIITLGDIGTFESEILEFGDGFFKAKALDDRLGCAVLLEFIKEDLAVDTWFAFTAQEEVGTRGGTVAAYRIEPEIALIVEGTTAADLPSVKGTKRICSPGKGVVIPFMDKGTLYDRELYTLLTNLADENGIPWQTKQLIAGGTDAAAVQRSRAGVKTAGIAVAIRNIHSPSCVGSKRDFEDLLKLARLFIEAQA
jgi:endoglucanase